MERSGTFAPNVLRYFFYPRCGCCSCKLFRGQAVYGDTEYGPFQDGCQHMIVFAEPV
jgi:hypothetical protein